MLGLLEFEERAVSLLQPTLRRNDNSKGFGPFCFALSSSTVPLHASHAALFRAILDRPDHNFLRKFTKILYFYMVV